MLTKAYRKIKQHGVATFSYKLRRHLLRKVGVKGEIEIVRDHVARHVRRLCGSTVKYGPFQGMILSESSSWGRNDVATKLLGHYEASVLQQIIELSNSDVPFIDIGSADGYFAVGVMKAGLFKKSICFEATERGRQVLRENAEINAVSHLVEIHGLADPQSIRAIGREIDGAVILCDIEDAEFTLLDDAFLDAARTCSFVIELHDAVIQGDPDRRRRLIDRASRLFDVSFLVSADLPISRFDELRSLPDDYRALAFSEGRRADMDWMVLKPKSRAA